MAFTVRTMHRRYEILQGTPITIEDHGGHGQPIVAVHGLGGSAGNWSLVGPRFAEMGRTLALDLPGHGRSGPAPSHDLGTHARTVVEAIEFHGFRRVILVANSMGGLVATAVTTKRPDLVGALVLLAPATPLPTIVVPSNPAVAARLAVQSLPGVGPLATAAIRARFTPRGQVEETLRIVMHDPSRLPADAFESAVELVRLRRTMPWASRAFAESVASVRRTLIRRSRYLGILDAVSVPTTLIYGSEDQVVSPVALRWLAGRQKSWRSIELPETGHTPMYERPDIVSREVARAVEASAARAG